MGATLYARLQTAVRAAVPVSGDERNVDFADAWNAGRQATLDGLAELEADPETIIVTLPRFQAEELAKLWEGDDGKGQEGYATLLRAVRDLFNGHDGFLHTLNDALGREH